MRKKEGLTVNTKVGIAILLITVFIIVWLCLDWCTRLS